MNDEAETTSTDLRDVEAELCRLPDVAAARIVADQAGRPIEVHVLAGSGKHAKQVVRDIQSVALASFGLDIDRLLEMLGTLTAGAKRSIEGEVAQQVERIGVRLFSGLGKVIKTDTTLSQSSDDLRSLPWIAPLRA